MRGVHRYGVASYGVFGAFGPRGDRKPGERSDRYEFTWERVHPVDHNNDCQPSNFDIVFKLKGPGCADGVEVLVQGNEVVRAFMAVMPRWFWRNSDEWWESSGGD